MITCTSPFQLKSSPDENFVCDYCRDMELVLAGVDLSNETTRYWVIYSLSVSMHVWLENPAADADAEDLEIVGKVFYDDFKLEILLHFIENSVKRHQERCFIGGVAKRIGR